ncbi:MAG: Na+/H+ antiporter subunit E [Caldilineaceae bacterium]|nr:Na+/H+ antiporter subunit E [Caldilineaceae bacterium]
MVRIFLLLLIVWLMLTAKLTLPNVVLGVVVALIAIAVTQQTNIARRGYRMFLLAIFFIWEVLVANVRIAIAILRPRLQLQPAIIAIPVEELSEPELVVLATFLTLTPGTLSVDVAPDQSTLYVHTFNLIDAEQFRREVKGNVQRAIQEVFR